MYNISLNIFFLLKIVMINIFNEKKYNIYSRKDRSKEHK